MELNLILLFVCNIFLTWLFPVDGLIFCFAKANGCYRSIITIIMGFLSTLVESSLQFHIDDSSFTYY